MAQSDWGDRLYRFGEKLESAGKTIQGLVGSVFLLILAFIFWQCASSGG